MIDRGCARTSGNNGPALRHGRILIPPPRGTCSYTLCEACSIKILSIGSRHRNTQSRNRQGACPKRFIRNGANLADIEIIQRRRGQACHREGIGSRSYLRSCRRYKTNRAIDYLKTSTRRCPSQGDRSRRLCSGYQRCGLGTQRSTGKGQIIDGQICPLPSSGTTAECLGCFKAQANGIVGIVGHGNRHFLPRIGLVTGLSVHIGCPYTVVVNIHRESAHVGTPLVFPKSQFRIG